MIKFEQISYVTVFVRDSNIALNWYCEMLGFEKREDFSLGGPERWVTIGLPGQTDVSIALECPSFEIHGANLYPVLAARIGKGSPVVLTTADCRQAHSDLVSRGARFLSGPTDFPWGTAAVLEDLYGNPITLLQPIQKASYDTRAARIDPAPQQAQAVVL